MDKAWKTSIANRELVVRSLARTNIAKRDADEWIARMEDEIMEDRSRSRYPEEERMDNSELIGRYN